MKLPLTGASATSTTSCCSLSGITCSGALVTKFNVASKGITGSIPKEIGNLKNLKRLALFGNQLTGSIPEEIGNLVNLEGLYFENNQLSGSIPLTIGSLKKLLDFRLNNNQLSGSIPTEIGNMKSLQILYLYSNQLNGSIPSSIGQLTNLVDLRLDRNQLSGSIPSSIGNLIDLKTLSLFRTQLTGSIPLSIGQLTNLLHLDIYNNPSLSGNFTPRCGIQVSAQATGVSLCGCASSNSPAIRFPPAGTSDACLATGPASPLVKRSLTFSAVIGSFRYTCNVDDNQNPFQDCLNTMGKLCNPTYMSGNSVRISECKNAINTMTLGMNIFWRNVRRDCGQWPLNGFTGAVTSNDCTYANNQLQNNAYYIADGIKIYVTSDLTSTVNAGLWGNPALKG